MKYRRFLFSAFTALGVTLAVILAGSGLSGGNATAAPPAQSSGSSHKVVVSRDTLPSGVGQLIADYGSYSLYRLTDQELNSLSAPVRSNVVVADEMDTLAIDALNFNTQAGAPEVPAGLRAPASNAASLHLIQFVGPIKDEWLDAVRATGAVPVQYIANNGYLVWADATARTVLSGMADSGLSFVQYSGPYHPYYKMGYSIRDRVVSESNPDELVKVVIQVYNRGDLDSFEKQFAPYIVEAESAWTPILAFANLNATVRASDLSTIVTMPNVNWVGERFERELFDEVQGQIVAGNLTAGNTGPIGPGYKAWLDSYGFSTNPTDYPIIDITDDGIGGNTAPTVPNNPTLDPSLDPRVIYRISCTSQYPNDGRGLDGHGHINASIAVGYDTRTGAPTIDPLGYNRGLGINPYGRVAGTRIFGGSYNITNCGGTDTGVIKASYLAGARISSNSWGCGGCSGSYDDSSQAYDAGTRDAVLDQAGNQELITIFAAGNDGSSAGTVGTPGNGKNMITVGASENVRPTWTDGCNVGPTGADNAMDIIDFSSRGPAPGQRVKPEIIAPGTHIQGTASTHPNYTGASVCDKYLPAGQTIYAASSGTSHSTPAVSGISSLYYRWMQTTHGIATPSPALMKAYLMAHPTYLTGVSANDTLPSNNQGYGMPNMTLAFDTTPRYFVNQSHLFGASGETWTFNGAVADPSKPVYIAMAYTDAPGQIGTSPQVNNLDLAATIGASSYRGNVFSGRWSVTGGTADTRNNYEAVFLPAGTSGPVTITVSAFAINGDGVPGNGDTTDQDFALVCYNCAQEQDFTLTANPNTLAVCAPATVTSLITVGSILGYTDPVTLSALNVPAGTTANFAPNPVTPPSTSTLTLNVGAATAPGSYSIDVLGVAATSTHTTTINLAVSTAAPAAPTLLTPANGALNQSTTPTFTWNAVPQAASYTLEIATDAGFATIVHTAANLTTTTYTMPTPLNTNTTYYWRVRAVNPCGEGTNSTVFSFTTLAAPGDCGIGTTPAVHYFTDFESGTTGWSTTGSTGASTWAISSARSHSPTNSYLAQDIASVSDQRLISPPISLPSGNSAYTLSFWNDQTLEDFSTGCFDGGLLEISTDAGSTWTQVPNAAMLTQPYTGPVSTGFSNPLAGMDAWCGDPTPWTDSVVDLNAYAGQTVQFRFRLGTDSSAGRTPHGWYVDDVQVQSCTTGAGPTATPTTVPGTTPTATSTTVPGTTPTATSTTVPGTTPTVTPPPTSIELGGLGQQAAPLNMGVVLALAGLTFLAVGLIRRRR